MLFKLLLLLPAKGLDSIIVRLRTPHWQALADDLSRDNFAEATAIVEKQGVHMAVSSCTSNTDDCLCRIPSISSTSCCAVTRFSMVSAKWVAAM